MAFKKVVLWVAVFSATGVSAQGIYTCVDARGRKLTADRPIVDCLDRTQTEMTPSGTVKRVIGPSLTAKERALAEVQEKERVEALARQSEEKRRDRALLVRYPNRALHDKERADALSQIDEVIKSSKQRAAELTAQAKTLDAAPATPESLRQRAELQSNINIQNRFIEGQEAEKSRINARFDEELTRLHYLWAIQKK